MELGAAKGKRDVTDADTDEAFVEQTENLKLQLSEDDSVAGEENEERNKTSNIEPSVSENTIDNQSRQDPVPQCSEQKIEKDAESSEDEDSETEEEAAERRRCNQMASPPASPTTEIDFTQEVVEQDGEDETQLSVEVLNVQILQETEEVVTDNVEVIEQGDIMFEEHTIEVSESIEKNEKEKTDDVVGVTQVATTLDGENIVIQDHEVEVATEEVSTTEVVPEDINLHGVVLDTNVGETGHDQCDMEQVEEEVMLEVFVSEETSTVETEVSVKEVAAEQAETVQEDSGKGPNTESEYQEEIQETSGKETTMEEKRDSEPSETLTNSIHEVGKDDGDVEIVAETIEDFIILPNEDYSDSGSEIVDAENTSAKSLVTSKEVSVEKQSHVKTSSREENVAVPQGVKSVTINQPNEKKPERDIQKQINIQLLKEYGKKIYGRGAQRKSVNSNEEEEKKKWKESKMKLKETTQKGNEDSIQKAHASHVVEEKKTQSGSENTRCLIQEETTNTIESTETLEEDNDATTALSELIGDIVRELSSESAGNKEHEITENSTQGTDPHSNSQEAHTDEHKNVENLKEASLSKQLESVEYQKGHGNTSASAQDKQLEDRNIHTGMVTPVKRDMKNGTEDPHLNCTEINNGTDSDVERTEMLGNRIKDAEQRKVEIEKNGDSSEEESSDEEEVKFRTRRQRNKMVSPPRSPSPMNATDESPSLDLIDKKNKWTNGSEKKSAISATSPSRSPEELDDRTSDAGKETVDQSESSEDEDEDYADARRKREVLSPPRSPEDQCDERTAEVADQSESSEDEDEDCADARRKREVLSPPRSPEDQCDERTAEVADQSESSEDEDEDCADARRKREVLSPPRSPEDQCDERTAEVADQSESSEDEDEDCADARRKREVLSPPRSPEDQCDERTAEVADQSESSEDEDEDCADARRKREVLSPPRSPEDQCDERTAEITDQSESSEDEDEDCADARRKREVMSPPRSPEGKFDERTAEAGKETVDQSESSEDEDEDCADTRKQEVLSPPRSPSPVGSLSAVEKVLNEKDDDGDSSEELNDESGAIVNRKRKVKSPPRSPSPDLCEKTAREEEAAKLLKDQSTDEDSDSDDETEIRRKRIRINSPPRSPSPPKSPQMEDLNTGQEKVLNDKNCNKEELRERKSSSPPVLQLNQRREASCDNADRMEIRETGSSSDDESDEECNTKIRIDITSPPRSPEPEPNNVSDRMTTEKCGDTTNKEKKLGSSSEESEEDDEVKSNKIITDFPPRSPSPERSAENSGIETTREELNGGAKHVEDSRDMKGSSSDEGDSDNDDQRKCVRADSPPRSPTPVRSDGASVKQAVEQNEIRRRTRQYSSDEESEEENEQINHTKEVSPPRSPSSGRNAEESNDNTTSEKIKKAAESGDEDSDDDAVTRRKCLRMMTPPRSPSPLRSADTLTHTEDLLKQETEGTKSGSNTVRAAKKHKLPSKEESSDEESDGPGTKVKCVRLDSPPRSPSPPPDTVEYKYTGRMSRRTAHNSRKAGLDLSLKPKHRVSSKENCDTCDSDSDEDDSHQSGSEESVHLPSPVSIRSPTPPQIMSPDYETTAIDYETTIDYESTAIDLSVKHDNIMHPVPDYTDGPRDQKEYNERSDQTVVLIPSEHGLLPPGFDVDDAMDVSDYMSYDPLEDVPGVINLATTRRGKKSASQKDSKRSASSGSVDDDGSQDHGPPNKRLGRKPDKSGNGNNHPSKSSKKSKSPCAGPQKRVLTPAEAPPSRESVIADILPLGLSQENHQDAFFSDPADVPERPR